MSKRHSDDVRYESSKKSRTEDSRLPELYSVFHAEVARVQPYGAFVKLPGYKRQGLVHKSQMSRAFIEDPTEMVSVGEQIYVKIISIEEIGEKISLSMKVVNQTTGQDLDPNNVELSQDERKKKQGGRRDKRIELGAVLDTTCRKCGGHGHLAQDCFHKKDGKVYDLVPDLDEMIAVSETAGDNSNSPPKKKKKDKKDKHKKKKKHRRHSGEQDKTEKDDRKHKKEKHKKHKSHKKERRASAVSSDSSSDS